MFVHIHFYTYTKPTRAEHLFAVGSPFLRQNHSRKMFQVDGVLVLKDMQQAEV